MKKIAITILRSFSQVFGVSALLMCAAVGPVFAGTITKTFEFGPGLAQLRSNLRTFPGVPCRKPVTLTVKFRTLGPGGSSNEVPIKIELRDPDMAPDQESPNVETKNATAKATEQTVTFSSHFQGDLRGCSRPLRVRVEHANAGTAPFITLCSIRLDFDTGVRNINFDGPGYIKKNFSKTINLSADGFENGKIVLTGDWVHDVLGVTGPNPIKLKFTLIDPNGTVVKTAEGFANRQKERDLGLPILKLIYQVTVIACDYPGQWKLGITNLDQNDDVSVKVINETFTPGCP